MEKSKSGVQKKKQTRRRSPEEKQRRRGEILSLATYAFIEGGYSAVKMREIAKELDTSAASLYSYFDNKDQILLAILEEGLLELEARINEIEFDDLFLYFKKISRIYLDFAERKPHLYQLMFPIGDEINLSNQGIKRLYRFIQIKTKPLFVNGDLKTTKVETFLESFWALLHGLVILSTKIVEDKYGSYEDLLIHVQDFLEKYF